MAAPWRRAIAVFPRTRFEFSVTADASGRPRAPVGAQGCRGGTHGRRERSDARASSWLLYEENSDKLLKERFGTKGAAIQAYIEKHNQPKLYKKGKDRDDILGRDFCPTNAISIPRVAR